MNEDPAILLLLGLLHPNGGDVRSRVVTSSVRQVEAKDEPADLVLVELGRSSRSEAEEDSRLVDSAVDELKADGLLAAVVPRLRRRRVAAQLRARGLDVAALAIRGTEAGEQLASVEWRAFSFALNLSSERNRKRRLVASMPRILRSRLMLLLPRIALIGHQPDAAPAQWLYRLEPDSASSGPVVASLSPRRDRAYLYRFSPADHDPTAVAKVGLTNDGTQVILREAVALRALASGAREAGAEVATLIHSTRIGLRPVLLESFVAGDPAAALLASEPHRLEQLIASLCQWLAGWNRNTRVVDVALPELLGSSVLLPLEALAVRLPPSFVEMVRADAAKLSARALPTTAAHHDLTMWNVLVRSDGRLGVLDWEQAVERALPLTDLFYALADACAATGGYRDREAAFRACFHSAGSKATWAGAIVAAQAQSLEIEDRLVAVSFVSCWLRHAAEEVRRGEAAVFLPQLREVAAAPERFWPLRSGGVMSDTG